MDVRDIMTANPACVTPADSIKACAKLMVECDCGLLPVVDNARNNKLLGVVTDRDIVTRVIAKDLDCNAASVQDCMTTEQLWCVKPTDSVDKVVTEMEQGRVRRIAVVDDNDRLLGIVSTADIAKEIEDDKVAEVFIEVMAPASKM